MRCRQARMPEKKCERAASVAEIERPPGDIRHSDSNRQTARAREAVGCHRGTSQISPKLQAIFFSPLLASKRGSGARNLQGLAVRREHVPERVGPLLVGGFAEGRAQIPWVVQGVYECCPIADGSCSIARRQNVTAPSGLLRASWIAPSSAAAWPSQPGHSARRRTGLGGVGEPVALGIRPGQLE